MRIGSVARNMWAFVMWMILGLCLGIIILGFAGCAGEALTEDEEAQAYWPEPDIGVTAQPLAIKTSGTATWGAKASTLNRERCNNSTTSQTCNYVYSAKQGTSEYRIRVAGFTGSEKTTVETMVDSFCTAMFQAINAQPAPVNTFSCFRVTSGETILVSKAAGGGSDGNVGSYASPLYNSCFTVSTESLPGTYKPCTSATINYARAAADTYMTGQGFSSSGKTNGQVRILDHALLAAMGIGGQSDTQGVASFNGVISSAVGAVIAGSDLCRFRAIAWGSNFDISSITSTTGC